MYAKYRMRVSYTLTACVLTAAVLALMPRVAAAQSRHPDAFERADAPALMQGFSAAQVRGLDRELEEDLRVLSAFAGKRRIDGFTESVEKPKPWTFYGRLGVLNFQNELEPERSNGMRFTLRRTGPRLTGRVYIGIHRSFH